MGHRAPLRTATASTRLLMAVRERGGEPGGYGIGTAAPYVRDVLACQDDICRVRFGSLDGSSLLAKAAKRLTYANQDTGVDGPLKLKSAADLPDGMVLPPRTLGVFRNVVTTTREDRDRDILHTKGARPDTKMPLLWQHIHTLPIGKMIQVAEHSDTKLSVWTALLDLNDMTEDAAKLIEAGALRISHGFLPDRWDERKAQSGDASNRAVGFNVWEFAIMEESLVSVPSNVDAEIELFSRNQLKDAMVRMHAKAKFDGRPVIVPGVDTKTPATDTPADDTATATTPEPVPQVIDEPAKAAPVLDDEPSPVKSGRTLSKANMAKLEDAVGDLVELAATELTRAQKLLVRSATDSVESVIATAAVADDAEPQKSAPASCGCKATSLTRAAAVLAGMTESETRSLRDACDAILSIADRDRKGESYRKLIAG